MKKVIQMLTELLNDSKTLEDAAEKLSELQPKYSIESATGIMQDVQKFVEGEFSEAHLCLCLENENFL